MGKPGGTSANIWTYASQGDVANIERLVQEGEDVDVQVRVKGEGQYPPHAPMCG